MYLSALIGIDMSWLDFGEKLLRRAMPFKISSLVENYTRESCEAFHEEFIANAGERRPNLPVVSYVDKYFGLYAKHILKIPALLVKLQHWVFDDPRRAPFRLPTLPTAIHKFINTKFMIPDEYRNSRLLTSALRTM
mmetsp:Transcript_29654/g.43845  ORF Transcript_29654/g.43845 Transcript_29654/m.43845 type:complete len:136 (-) Transcript_29654:642-1049(-)